MPRPGSVYLDQIMSGVRRALDEVRLDGIYCDEFYWAGRSRGYSRYDYGRWDGYAADLGDDAEVIRLKSDNGFVSESCQLRMVNEVLRRELYRYTAEGELLDREALPTVDASGELTVEVPDKGLVIAEIAGS